MQTASRAATKAGGGAGGGGTSGAAGGGAKPLTTLQNNAYWGKTSTVEQLIKDGQAKGLSEQQIRANLMDGQNPSKSKYDQVMIEAAYELLGYGSITQSTAANLHNYGVRGGTYNGKPIKVTPNYKPPEQSPPGSVGAAVQKALGGISF